MADARREEGEASFDLRIAEISDAGLGSRLAPGGAEFRERHRPLERTDFRCAKLSEDLGDLRRLREESGAGTGHLGQKFKRFRVERAFRVAERRGAREAGREHQQQGNGKRVGGLLHDPLSRAENKA